MENVLLPATSSSMTGLAVGQSWCGVAFLGGPLVRPYAGAVGPGFLLMQDNDRPHVAGGCQQVPARGRH